MKFRSVCLVGVILVVLGAILTGCVGGTTKPSKFYLLRSIEGSQGNLSTTSESAGVSVILGPITLPAYLDREQMIILGEKHEVVLDEFNRWAESLQDNFYRVLTENLSLLLKTPKVYAFDRSGSIPADFQVAIDVTRFDSTVGGDAHLTAFWTVSTEEGGTHPIKRKSVFRAAVPSTGVAGVVEAQNKTLTELSREIARAIQSLHR
jgi:uncharacterized lipoprotein YmbA